MCGTVALGLLGGLIASKLLFRGRFRHLRHHRRGPWGRRRFDAGGDVPPAPVELDTPRRLHGLLGPLELNQRQTEEAREAFADVAQALGAAWAKWSGLDEALAAIAADPFDKARAQAALTGLEAEPGRL